MHDVGVDPPEGSDMTLPRAGSGLYYNDNEWSRGRVAPTAVVRVGSLVAVKCVKPVNGEVPDGFQRFWIGKVVNTRPAVSVTRAIYINDWWGHATVLRPICNLCVCVYTGAGGGLALVQCF